MKSIRRYVALGIVAAARFFVAQEAAAQMAGMTHSNMSQNGMANSPFDIPMNRMGSGTTWIPDAVPIPSQMFKTGSWDWMLHGYAFAQHNKQQGSRGDSQFGSLNWGMLMVGHELLGGRFQARTMLSFDAATVGKKGYPLLLQSGEIYEGQPIVDRQHPHDVFMELGMLYERAMTKSVGFSLYAAPSGEPALGPVAFMHRPSAVETPMAPLSHHWQDATHISFGVFTAGLFGKHWKLEASAFNGREPNEHRWDFDRLNIDSYSGRLTVNPGSKWSLTAGYGFLKSPEALHADESVRRVTSSVLHSTMFGTDGQLATSFVWGANRHGDADEYSHSLLAESRLVLRSRNTLFTRVERVQKTADDLLAYSSSSATSPDPYFNVVSASLGYVREVVQGRGVSIGLGAIGTLNVLPESLERFYGSRNPKGGMLFFRLRPIGVSSTMHSMEGMNHEAPG